MHRHLGRERMTPPERPPTRVIGVDLGGTKLLAGLLDEQLQVRRTVRRAVAGLTTDELLDTLVVAVDEVREASDEPVAAVGFGIPCLMDRRGGRAALAINLPLVDVPFRELMEERLDLPVDVDNDGNVAALAEHRAGAAYGLDHVVLLTLGTGVGGGLILDGKPYRGANGAGAELGHLGIDLDGPPCQGACPARGCLETHASGTALAREARHAALAYPASALGQEVADGRTPDGELVATLARAGDAVARRVLEGVGRHLGAGIASLLNVFDPELVVIGGGLAAAGPLLLDPARAEVARRVLPPLRERAPIVPAHFGGEAGLVGAGVLALELVASDSHGPHRFRP
jgi:glucokinase